VTSLSLYLLQGILSRLVRSLPESPLLCSTRFIQDEPVVSVTPSTSVLVGGNVVGEFHDICCGGARTDLASRRQEFKIRLRDGNLFTLAKRTHSTGKAVGCWQFLKQLRQRSLRKLRSIKPRSVNGKSWIEAKEADLVRDAAKSLDAEPSPSG
jgi:hypothetical protein